MMCLVREYNGCGCLILEIQLVIHHNRNKKVSHKLLMDAEKKTETKNL